MSAKSESESDRPSPAREGGIDSVILLVGGTFQGVTPCAEAADDPDVIIYADVQSEIIGVAPRVKASS